MNKHFCDYGTCTETATTKIDECWYCTRHAKLIEPPNAWKGTGWDRRNEREWLRNHIPATNPKRGAK
jgi:hypothetical protein